MMTDFRSCQQQYCDNPSTISSPISVSSYGNYFHPNNTSTQLDGQYSQFTSSYTPQFYQPQSYDFDCSSTFLPQSTTTTINICKCLS